MLSFFSISGWGIDLDYCDVERFALEMNRDHSVIFEITPKYCIMDSLVDCEGYSILLRENVTSLLLAKTSYVFLLYLEEVSYFTPAHRRTHQVLPKYKLLCISAAVPCFSSWLLTSALLTFRSAKELCSMPCTLQMLLSF